ncbi:hypothetical protein [Streptomyces tricolor]|uniref:hypothetical protein n=1 Tax=Streptomyces tricolor TaxID=68277 RepID=UPI0036E0CAA6
MNGTYEPPNLLPAGGPERTHALLIAGIPLLLILLIGVVPHLASDDDGDHTAPVYGAAPSAPAYGTGTTQPDPSPYATQTTGGGYTNPYATQTTDEESTDPYATESAEETAYGTSGPAETVTRFFDAINRRDYDTAWELGGKNLDPSYSSFVAGFATTQRDDVTITSVDGETVSVNLLALQTDGTQKSYSGRYTVVDGVITRATMAAAD